MTFKIITCPEWGAVEPRDGLASIIWTPGPSPGIIFHHTDGHHAEISRPQDESTLEAMFYQRSIQKFHMRPKPLGRGWNDTGNNFTVMRNGEIYQGRWRTVRAIHHRRMVVSAHCPHFNDWIGIEHEHVGTEEMTLVQKQASAWLQASAQVDQPADRSRRAYAVSAPKRLSGGRNRRYEPQRGWPGASRRSWRSPPISGRRC